MNYPPFSLEKALQGEPVARHIYDKCYKGYVTESKITPKHYVLESDAYKDDISVYSLEELLIEIQGMWVEPAAFKHWDVLSEDVVKIEQYAKNSWALLDKCNTMITTTHTATWIQGFFPECPEGTVIERPRGV